MGDVEKMIAIGLVWGVTNALMRKGALLWDRKLQSSPVKPQRLPQLHQRLLGYLNNWLDLLLVWQYSVPFLLNLSASAAFFAVLSDSPISLAVPVTNATTFAATAISAMLLAEVHQLVEGNGGTMADAYCSIPLASPWPKPLKYLDMKVQVGKLTKSGLGSNVWCSCGNQQFGQTEIKLLLSAPVTMSVDVGVVCVGVLMDSPRTQSLSHHAWTGGRLPHKIENGFQLLEVCEEIVNLGSICSNW
ncbi:hypothetical protein NE237_025359 [Protea cynaroides]|uniref:Transmembrane protein 234 n=1 Tax=Protea cynaroides TaxID=273540 RepID=A0A9Q0K1P0_9MAGN|nr:hypothetical protein NE237_025359 [Protea cynaroides]